jgi:ABC-type multidrug transport system ATPase subunit
MSDAAIEISKVSKQFPRVRACDDITLSIPKGGIYGLLGPNGAGKTTLFSIVAGFLRPTSGDIKVLGVDTRNVSELRGRIAILPQDAKFAANTPVGDQIVLFAQLHGRTRAEAEKDAATALQRVGLPEAAMASASTLSHGMYKRVGIAQAFLGNPEVILLDEPTAGLDPVAAAGIRDLIKELHAAGVTLVVSSHNLPEIQKLCEAVAILDKGKLVTWSKVKDLTQADRIQRMTFARDLTAAELETVKSVPGVRGIDADGEKSYRIHIELGDRTAEQLTADIVSKLVATGAVPRNIEDGVTLETRFLELTKPKP